MATVTVQTRAIPLTVTVQLGLTHTSLFAVAGSPVVGASWAVGASRVENIEAVVPALARATAHRRNGAPEPMSGHSDPCLVQRADVASPAPNISRRVPIRGDPSRQDATTPPQ
jgi:hypothetical protein